MNNELQLGKYEFFPYEDKPENTEDILEELKELLKTVKKRKKGKGVVQDKSVKRKRKNDKKQS